MLRPRLEAFLNLTLLNKIKNNKEQRSSVLYTWSSYLKIASPGVRVFMSLVIWTWSKKARGGLSFFNFLPAGFLMINVLKLFQTLTFSIIIYMRE